MNHANTQIKDFQKKMEKSGLIYLGDGSDFYRMKKESDALGNVHLELCTQGMLKFS